MHSRCSIFKVVKLIQNLSFTSLGDSTIKDHLNPVSDSEDQCARVCHAPVCLLSSRYFHKVRSCRSCALEGVVGYSEKTWSITLFLTPTTADFNTIHGVLPLSSFYDVFTITLSRPWFCPTQLGDYAVHVSMYWL